MSMSWLLQLILALQQQIDDAAQASSIGSAAAAKTELHLQ
jgi:hypothetical protein